MLNPGRRCRAPAPLAALRLAALRLAALLLAALLLPTLLSACSSTPTPPGPPGPVSKALAPAPEGPIAAAEQALAGRLRDGESGFLLLHRNADALRWRQILIDGAQRSLDLQYYVWFGDQVGQALMQRVLAAANRGVRVRLLFDDLSTLLHDMTHVELRDALLLQLDRHPRIEIRVFNSWRQRELLGRAVEAGTDFERLNRRMHNKQMVADNRMALIGGRNIGDEYFGLNPTFNFYDLDVLGVGPVARQASAVFDRYWNSPWVRPLARLAHLARMAPQAGAEPSGKAAAGVVGPPQPPMPGIGADQLAPLQGHASAGRSVVIADPPARGAEVHNQTPIAFHSLLRSAQREVLLTNAYVIPDARLIDELRQLGARGVRVRMLTNSLSSHDVAAVNSHYERWRLPLLEAGVELHELRSDMALRESLVETAPVRGQFVGLHTKAMVVDRRWSFVGSMNMDPRSEQLNTEMGVVIDSEPLARLLAAQMDEDMGAANSWRVERDAGARLRWVSGAETLSRQPARSLWQRVENLFFKLFPPRLY